MLVSAGVDIAAQSAKLLLRENGGSDKVVVMARKESEEAGKTTRSNTRKGEIPYVLILVPDH